MKDKSRRPRHNPKEHTREEIKLIRNYKSNNKKTGLVVLWVKLRQAGYRRTVTSLYRMLIKLNIYEKAPSKKKEKNGGYYPEMEYPGEKVQVDVKYVPKKCLSKELQESGERFYQYTAIDEYTRIRYLWFSNGHDTLESTKFIEKLIEIFPFKIKTIQTDNGFEFTNRLSWNIGTKERKTMFENKLKELGIEYKQIKPHTPKQNGKVERSHRKDQERFYYEKIFYSLEDLKSRAKYWIREYNNFPMRPLGWMSPKEKLEEYMCKVK
jgi:transposase InsO family protein